MADFEEFILTIPPVERLITTKLRSLILDCDPHIQEKFSYGVPYYSHYRRICFVWPFSCVPCGYPEAIEQGVTLGFCYGNRLSNSQRILQMEKRKQVAVIRFPASKNSMSDRSRNW